MINHYLIKKKSTNVTNKKLDLLECDGTKKTGKSKYFIKGPIDWNWICSAAKSTGKTLQVALAIQFLSGLYNCNTIKLPNKILSQLGVDRFSKYRAIKILEAENLIKVARKKGQAPLITIIY